MTDFRHNPNALVYDNHQVDYPQFERRANWVELARVGRVVIRDDPDGPVPCTHGHEDCLAVVE